MIKRILLVVLVLVVVAQLIQPDRSVPPVDPSKDMLTMLQAPADIQALAIGACYDCHSDRTDYPVWAYVTPINFMIQDHIDEGREVVNFSRWDLFASNEEAMECAESMAEGEMPPALYASMHGHAQLSKAGSKRLMEWFDGALSSGKRGSDGAGIRNEEHEEREEH